MWQVKNEKSEVLGFKSLKRSIIDTNIRFFGIESYFKCYACVLNMIFKCFCRLVSLMIIAANHDNK